MKQHSPLSFRKYFIAAAAFVATIAYSADTPYQVVPEMNNSLQNTVLFKGQPVLSLGFVWWGPSWGWVGNPASREKAKPGQPLKFSIPLKVQSDVITLGMEASATSNHEVAFKYDLTTDKDVAITMIALTFNIPKKDAGTKMTITDGGKDVDFTFPLGMALQNTKIHAATKAVFHLASGDVTATFEPAIAITSDGDMRVQLADKVCKAGTTSEKITFAFPQPNTYAATDEDAKQFICEPGANWFPWSPNDFASPSVIGMEDWLDKPAGKHGGVRLVGDHFELEDGTRIKFWGTNLAFNDCAPKKANAEAVANRFAKFGVNAVRLHKFSNPGWEGIGDPKDGTQFTKDGLDLLDNMTYQLASRGIYYGFSHSFVYKVREANKGRYLAYDEIVKNLGGKTYALINYAEDIQDVMIEMVVNLLKHQNAYTQKTYAEDPALAWIELQNEDDIFFFTTSEVLQKCPTYTKKFTEQYAEWLKERYGSQEKLAEAWGHALKAGETLEAKNIRIVSNPWEFGSDNLPGKNGGDRQRLLDNAHFFHDTQNKFYAKFVKAIRDAGYKGPIEGSPWQAPSGIPHYYNLRSDYLAGFIDRHNYGNNKFDGTELRPGLGFFSTGLQQVIDRPFGLSEWINCFPSHYQAEAPSMVAVYGFGLQGWDASFEFTSIAKGGFHEGVGGLPWSVWHVDTPANMGQFPALARMIYRGDVKEADVISARKVSLEELEKGQLSFSDKVTQNGDVKTFAGAVPPEAMLAGRCVVQFTDKPEPSIFPDLTKYKKGAIITSSTDQLTWDASNPDRCSFTVNTPGTKAVVGFADGKVATLGNVTLTSHTPYISLFLTAMTKSETLDNAKSALISIISRNTTPGLKIWTIGNKILNEGKGAFVLEPVLADIKINGRSIEVVNVLDADGKRTNTTVPVKDGLIQLDSGRDKTMYYEVVFK